MKKKKYLSITSKNIIFILMVFLSSSIFAENSVYEMEQGDFDSLKLKSGNPVVTYNCSSTAETITFSDEEIDPSNNIALFESSNSSCLSDSAVTAGYTLFINGGSDVENEPVGKKVYKFSATLTTVDQFNQTSITNISDTITLDITTANNPTELTVISTPNTVSFSGNQGGTFTNTTSNQVIISGSCENSSDAINPSITFSASYDDNNGNDWLTTPSTANPSCVNNSYSYTYTLNVDNDKAAELTPDTRTATMTYSVLQGENPATATTSVSLIVNPVDSISLTAEVSSGAVIFSGNQGGPFSNTGSNQVIISGTCDSSYSTIVDITTANTDWVETSSSTPANCNSSNNTYSHTFDISLDNAQATTLKSGTHTSNLSFSVKQGENLIETSSTVRLTIDELPKIHKELDKNVAASYVVGSKTMRATTTNNSRILRRHVKNILKPGRTNQLSSNNSDYARGFIAVTQYIEQNQERKMDATDAFRQFLQGSNGLQYGLSAGDGLLQKAIWLNASHINIDDDGIRSFNADSNVFMGGFDYRFGQLDNMVIGISLSYTEMDANTSYNNGNLNNDEMTFTGYFGALYGDNFMFDAQLGYGNLDYDQDRLNDSSGSASGSKSVSNFDANKYFLSINGSYFKTMDQLSLIANWGYLYANEKQDAYTESTGGYLPSQKLKLGQLSLGGEVNYLLNENIEFITGLDFIYDTTYEQIIGDNVDRSSIDGNVGLNIFISDALDVNLTINKVFGRDKYDEESYSFNLRYSF